jgi:glycosyltransferase involved in cell wall biosynthesis
MKDHDNFFRAAAVVSKAHPEVRFLLAGWGMSQDQPGIAKLLREYQLQSRTFLLGERSDMARLTASLDLACSASWAEGFSNTIGEAMACGIPCVVTDVGDSSYIVADTGLAVPARNHEALARAILALIEAGPVGRQQLGMAARHRVENEFSLPTIVRRYEDLYQEHLGSRSLPSP